MDEYILQTMTQIVFILMFESSTVFQRQRTMKMLNGMTVKPFDVKVFRNGYWTELSTSDLLPGDLLQLTVNKATADTQSKPPAAEEARVEKSFTEQVSAAWKAQSGQAANKSDPNAGVCVVPCDCILLRGEAVVNE